MPNHLFVCLFRLKFLRDTECFSRRDLHFAPNQLYQIANEVKAFVDMTIHAVYE